MLPIPNLKITGKSAWAMYSWRIKIISPKEITYAIMEDVINFSLNGEYSDDKTIVVIKRMK